MSSVFWRLFIKDWPGGFLGWLAGDEPTAQISATDLMRKFFKEHPGITN